MITDNTSKSPLELARSAFQSLPKAMPFELGMEPEYYGALHLIASKCRVKEVRPFAPKTWLHGWQSRKPLSLIHQIILWGHENHAHMVHTREQRDFARSLGYRFAEAIGAPFTYVGQSTSTRIPNSLLVMPPHGIPQSEIKGLPYDYIDYIADLRKEFDVVAACVFSHDCKIGDWPRELDKLGIPWIAGASIDDRNALFRMRAIFDSFEFMTTNSIGSHVAYAALCGCKVSVSGPAHVWDPEIFRNDPWYKDKQDLFEFNFKTSAVDNAKQYHNHLFCHPRSAVTSVPWARKELGYGCRKRPWQLKRLFGWSKTARFLHNFRGMEYPS